MSMGEHHNKDWQILSRQYTNNLKRVGWHVVAKLLSQQNRPTTEA